MGTFVEQMDIGDPRGEKYEDVEALVDTSTPTF